MSSTVKNLFYGRRNKEKAAQSHHANVSNDDSSRSESPMSFSWTSYQANTSEGENNQRNHDFSGRRKHSDRRFTFFDKFRFGRKPKSVSIIASPYQEDLSCDAAEYPFSSPHFSMKDSINVETEKAATLIQSAFQDFFNQKLSFVESDSISEREFEIGNTSELPSSDSNRNDPISSYHSNIRNKYWTPPESWNVKSEDGETEEDPYNQQSALAKLLDSLSQHYYPEKSPLSNTTLISPSLISTVPEEGIKPPPPKSLSGYQTPTLSFSSGLLKLSSMDTISIASKTSDEWEVVIFKGIAKFNGHQLPSVTIKIPLESTVKQIVQKLKDKFYSENFTKYKLFMIHHNLERQLNSNDKPVLLIKKWLEELGYTEKDPLNVVSGEVANYLYKLTFSDYPSNYVTADKYQKASDNESVYKIPSQTSLIINSNFADLSNFSSYMMPLTLFKYVSTLEYLNVSNNLLWNLPGDFCQACESLVVLVMSNKELECVPSTIILAKKIKNLNLSINFLREPSSIHNLGKFQHLQILNLEVNHLYQLPRSFVELKKLKHLILSNNAFTEFPFVLVEMPQLETINLSFNSISVIPNEIQNISSLTELIMSCNLLTTLPGQLSALRKLIFLDVRGNAIQDCSAIKKLSGIQRFIADYNFMNYFPDIQMPSVVDLSLTHNAFSQILFKNCKYERLNCISLSNAKLVSLPNNFFECCPNLQRISLDNNQLKSLPLSLSCVASTLKVLTAKKNKLSEIPTCIGDFHELKILDLRGNNLMTLPQEIWRCLKLEKLNLSSNLLTTFPMPPNDLLKILCIMDYKNHPALPPRPLQPYLSPQYDPLNQAPPPTPINTTGNITPAEIPLKTRRNSIGSMLNNFYSAITLNNNLSDNRDSEIILPCSYTGFSDSESFISIKDKSPFSSKEEEGLKSEHTAVSGQHELYGLPLCLRELYIGENRLTDEGLDAIQYLFELTILNLSYNFLVEIGGELKNLVKLRELYLSGNRLSCFPEDIQRMPLLKALYINGNKLVNIPAELSSNSQLGILDVSDNNLKYNISNWPYDWNWSWNRELRYLNLSGNKKLDMNSVKPGAGHVSNPSAPGPQQSNLASSSKKQMKSKESIHRLSVESKYSSLEKCATDFSSLEKLRVLDMSGVKIMSTEILPKETKYRRVRFIPYDSTEASNPALGVKYGPIPLSVYGVAESLARNNHDSTTWDFVNFKFNPVLTNSSEVNYVLGIFDGHANSDVANFLNNSFPYTYKIELQKSEMQGRQGGSSSMSSLNLIEQESKCEALRRTFLYLNKELFNAKFDVNGAIGIVAHLVGNRLIVANVGNSMGVVCREGHPVVVSTKHSPWNRVERARIKSVGGYVDSQGMVNGNLGLSRAFGYSTLIPEITANPSFHIIDLIESDEFLILASPEFWNFVDPQTAVDLARREALELPKAAKKLRDVALSYGASESLTVVILGLKESTLKEPVELPKLKAASRRHPKDEVIDSSLARLADEIPSPSGFLTLVFTDIRNSTPLWEVFPSAMESAVKAHHSLMRRLFRTIGGYEVKTDGDSFMAAFPTLTKALRWCLLCQSQLLETDWPQEILDSAEGRSIYACELEPSKLPPEDSVDISNSSQCLYRGLSVRMGIHCGSPLCELDPITQRMDYYGSVVNKASRVMNGAAGGQIFLSHDAYLTYLSICEVERGTLPEHTSFYVGERKLKGLEVSEHMYVMYPKHLETRYYFEKNSSVL